jgi:hypothetical protein
MMMSHDSAFESLLSDHDPDGLRRHAGTVFGLWPDLTLSWFNPAWQRFADENAGGEQIASDWGLGRSVLEATPDVIRPWYETAYLKCFETKERLEHVYECSSHKLFRRFHQMIYPLADASGLLVVNSLVVEHDHDMPGREARAASPRDYRDEDGGLVNMCCHCRRVRHCLVEERWDWVPEWVVRQPENVSHGLCPSCFGHYYPDRSGLS